MKTRSLTQALLQHRVMLFGFAYALVRDVVVAEEIFQEVAVVAMEKERKGDEVIREPVRWLKEVIRRHVQAGYRTRQGRTVNVEQEYLEQIAEGIDADSGRERQEERLAALGGCLEQVSEENRDLLRRRYVAGDGYEEIARAVQRTAGALRVLIHRLQRRLADCVEEKLQG